ncbi:MAG: hypothetical protein WDN30_06550 [Pararobbsia sp.]
MSTVRFHFGFMRFSHRWRRERVADELKATDTRKTASESGGFFMPLFE